MQDSFTSYSAQTCRGHAFLKDAFVFGYVLKLSCELWNRNIFLIIFHLELLIGLKIDSLLNVLNAYAPQLTVHCFLYVYIRLITGLT